MSSNPDALRQALEASLAENFDDLATHHAYADHLAEEGDPRGEFIQVQLALEDPKRKGKERKQLQKREKQLLDQHLAEWIGEAADLFQPDADHEQLSDKYNAEWYGPPDIVYTFARG